VKLFGRRMEPLVMMAILVLKANHALKESAPAERIRALAIRTRIVVVPALIFVWGTGRVRAIHVRSIQRLRWNAMKTLGRVWSLFVILAPEPVRRRR